MPETTTAPDPEIEHNRARYLRAMHGVQSAIAFEITNGGDAAAAATPKHLRVGINGAMVDASAVAGLLIQKGLFSEAEYVAALADGAERELELLTDRARQLSGIPNLNFG